jgi:hypothetical protein
VSTSTTRKGTIKTATLFNKNESVVYSVRFWAFMALVVLWACNMWRQFDEFIILGSIILFAVIDLLEAHTPRGQIVVAIFDLLLCATILLWLRGSLPFWPTAVLGSLCALKHVGCWALERFEDYTDRCDAEDETWP